MSAGMLLEDRLRGQDGALLYRKQMKLHANLTHVTVPFSWATSDVCQSVSDMRKGRCKQNWMVQKLVCFYMWNIIRMGFHCHLKELNSASVQSIVEQRMVGRHLTSPHIGQSGWAGLLRVVWSLEAGELRFLVLCEMLWAHTKRDRCETGSVCTRKMSDVVGLVLKTSGGGPWPCIWYLDLADVEAFGVQRSLRPGMRLWDRKRHD